MLLTPSQISAYKLVFSTRSKLPLVEGKDRDLNLIALDDALSGLEKIDPMRGRIMEMRFFGGLSNEEAAFVLGVSPATVQRQWAGARAWLFHALKTGGGQ